MQVFRKCNLHPLVVGTATLLLVLGVHRVSGQTTSLDKTHQLRQAEAALKTNDTATAARLFRNVLVTDPDNLEAHANLGAIAFFQGDCPAAETQLRAALSASPALSRAKALLSICERRRGDPAGQADMESAFATLDDPKLRLQIGIELANGYYQQGDLERTAAILHTLLETSPENVDILFFAQRVYSALADNTLNKLAILSPNSARMEQLIAERLINAGDLKDAATHYRKALALNGKLPGVHYELAETLMEAAPNDPGTRKEAGTQLQAAVQSDGDSAKVQCQLGRIALLDDDRAVALTHYRRAYELNPADSQAQIGLAELLRMDNKLTEAAAYLRLAVKADPFNAEAHYKLSQIDRSLHQESEAKSELQLFLDLRASRDKVKFLYRQMSPQTSAVDAATTSADPAATSGDPAAASKP